MSPATPPPVTPASRSILRHSLGLTYKARPYRRHYCTRDGEPVLEALVAAGLMERGRLINDGRDRYYLVTQAGIDAVCSTPITVKEIDA